MLMQLMQMTLEILNESRSHDQKSEHWKKMEINSMINQCGTFVFFLVSFSQVLMSSVFFWRSRKIKEISWLPKLIIILINIDGIMYSCDYISQYFFHVPVSDTARFWMRIVDTFTHPVI